MSLLFLFLAPCGWKVLLTYFASGKSSMLAFILAEHFQLGNVFIRKQKYMEKVVFRLAETFLQFEDFLIPNTQAFSLFIFFPLSLYSWSCWEPLFLRQNLEKLLCLQGNIIVGLWLNFYIIKICYQVNTKGYWRKLFFSDDSREYLNNTLHFYNEIHYEVSPCCIWTV